MRPLDPAPVSVLNEPYERAVERYNKESREAALAEHAKKLGAAPAWRRALRIIRRIVCCCLCPSAEEVPPVYKPVEELPPNVYVGPQGNIIRTGSAVYDATTEDRTARRFL
jgi:hypothetical protein